MIIVVTAFIVYSIALHLENPGTIKSEIFSFCNVWILFGCALIFCGIYKKKNGKSFLFALKKWQKIAFFVILSSAFLICATNLFFIINPKIADLKDAQALILLGGGIDKNGELPKSAKNRVLLAIKYLRENEKTICVCTGGSLLGLPSEASAMKRMLIEEGIEESRIFIDEKAENTIENFKNSAEILSSNLSVSVDKILESEIVVVTNFFHLARAQRIAKRLGFTKIFGLGAKISAHRVLDCYAREICAYVKLNLQILLKNEPNKMSKSFEDRDKND